MNPLALKETIKEIKNRHQLGDYGGKSPHNVETLEFCLLELESRLPRWIPVEERLPEEWEYVLLEVPENPPHYKVVGYRIGSLFRDHTHQVVKEVSNWMPLLKGQKEKEVDTMPVKVKKWEWSMGIFPSVLQATRHLTEEEAENYRQTHEYAWKHKITETEMEEEVMNRRIGDEW